MNSMSPLSPLESESLPLELKSSSKSLLSSEFKISPLTRWIDISYTCLAKLGDSEATISILKMILNLQDKWLVWCRLGCLVPSCQAVKCSSYSILRKKLILIMDSKGEQDPFDNDVHSETVCWHTIHWFISTEGSPFVPNPILASYQRAPPPSTSAVQTADQPLYL